VTIDGKSWDEMEETDEIKVSVERWYDRSLRLWTLVWKNAAGQQVGDAQYASSREEANQTYDRMMGGV
jgi:hypothetical protein